MTPTLTGPSIDWLRYTAKNTGRSRGDRALRSKHKREAARKQREKMKKFNRTNACGAKHRKAMAKR